MIKDIKLLPINETKYTEDAKALPKTSNVSSSLAFEFWKSWSTGGSYVVFPGDTVWLVLFH